MASLGNSHRNCDPLSYMRSHRAEDLIQGTWCPYEKGSLETDTSLGRTPHPLKMRADLYPGGHPKGLAKRRSEEGAWDRGLGSPGGNQPCWMALDLGLPAPRMEDSTLVLPQPPSLRALFPPA